MNTNEGESSSMGYAIKDNLRMSLVLKLGRMLARENSNYSKHGIQPKLTTK